MFLLNNRFSMLPSDSFSMHIPNSSYSHHSLNHSPSLILPSLVWSYFPPLFLLLLESPPIPLSPPMHWSVLSLSLFPLHPSMHLLGSLLLLTSGDGDQLLCSLGNVVSALDDLLSEELVVHCRGPRLRWRRLTALHLQPWGTGSQQPEGAVDCIQCRALRRNGGNQNLHGGWFGM